MKGTQSVDKKQSETAGEYEVKLEEIRGRIERNAETEVLELYVILTKKEDRKPKEARKLLEHDLGDFYTKGTILKYLPDECKDTERVESGKKGRAKQLEEQNKITVLADGSTEEKEPAALRANSSSVGEKEPKLGSSTSGNVDIEELQNRISNLTNDFNKATATIGTLQEEIARMRVSSQKAPPDSRYVLVKKPHLDTAALKKFVGDEELQETIVDLPEDLDVWQRVFTDPKVTVTKIIIHHSRGVVRNIRVLVRPIND